MIRITTNYQRIASVLAVIFGAALLSSSSTQADPLALLINPPYRAWSADTFIISANNLTTYVYWLDDETLFFAGYPEHVTSRNFRSVQSELFLWKLGELPHPYPTQSWSKSRYCASPGVIVYERQPPDGVKSAVREMRGPPGEEVDSAVLNLQYPPTAYPNSDNMGVDDIDCRRYSDVKMVGRSWVADATRTFYLDFGPSGGPSPAQHVVVERADGSGRTELPIAFTDRVAICTHSHKFASAFFVWNCMDRSEEAWRDANCRPVWKVELPAGEVEKICIPYGVWAGASIEIVPTKAGMFFTSRRQSTNDPFSPDEAGLYRMNDGSVKRILPGLIDHIKISPSGCKIAFVYAPNFMATQFEPPIKQQDRSKVVAIDVCSKP